MEKKIDNFKQFESRVTNKWKFKIKIKYLLSNDDMTLPTPENKKKIANKSSFVISELKTLLKRIEKSNIKEDVKDRVLEELEMIIDNFDFLKKLADGTISEDTWHEYTFDGNFQEWFNDYLTQLYDLGDKRVITTNGNIDKLLWVG
jgi:hypothetical protein